MTQVFLSHSKHDAHIAAQIAADLREAGFSVWKAPESILPGEEWIDAIQRGLTTSSHFVFVMSPDAVASKWVRYEFRTALRRYIAEKMVIVPLDYLPCETPDFWQNHQHISIREDYRAGLFKLIRQLNSEHPLHPPDPTPYHTINIVIEKGIYGNVNIAGRDFYADQPENPPTDPALESSLLAQELANAPTQVALKKVRSGPSVGLIGGGIAGVAVVGMVALGVMFSDVLNGKEASKAPIEEVPVDENLSADIAEGELEPTAEGGISDPLDIRTPAPAYDVVQQNSDWEPVYSSFDGVEMALVPVGCFTMGVLNGERDERPVSEVCIDAPFWIDVYEVTNQQFGSTGCAFYSSRPEQPRNCVSWYDANAHCENRNARLPWESEWEYAARGPDDLKYPWGDDFVAKNVVYNLNSDEETAAVGSRAGGTSWVGAQDMAGNLWEWTASNYELYPYDRTDGREELTGDEPRAVRGGSFDLGPDVVRPANRSANAPGVESNIVGFRCARDVE